MAQAWQTVEEAALTLGISSRTLHRRMTKGEFQTRLENGRREVLVVIPDPEPVAPPHWQTPADAPEEASGDETELSEVLDAASGDISEQVQETMLALHEDRIRRTDLAIMAYQQSVNVTAADARRAHRTTRVAWSVAGSIVVGMFLAATWATHSVTRARADVEHLNGVVRQLTDTAEARSREVTDLRTRAEDARLTAARIEGQLAAAAMQIQHLAEGQAAKAEQASQAAQAGFSAAADSPGAAVAEPHDPPAQSTAAPTQPVAPAQPAHQPVIPFISPVIPQ